MTDPARRTHVEVELTPISTGRLSRLPRTIEKRLPPERGVVVASDLDATTLIVDCWGDGARSLGNDLFDVVWAAVRDLHPPTAAGW